MDAASNADLPLPTRMLLGVATLFSDMIYIPLTFFAAVLERR